MIQRVLCWIYSIVYRKWLWNDFYKNHDKVIRVINWRTAIVASGKAPEYRGQRRGITPCFWWFD